MSNTHLYARGWTDLAPDTRFRNRIPTVIITADEIANGEWDDFLGDDFNPGRNREVVYVDDDGERWPMELVLYVHPTGAGALTIHSGSASVCRGRILGEDGAFSQSKEDVAALAGGMLSHYSETSSQIGSSTDQQPVWNTQIQEGDAIWLVRRGRYFALADGAGGGGGVSAAQVNLVVDNSNGTDGAVQDSVGTIANLAEVKENITGISGKCIGRSYEAEGATEAGYADIHLELPPRYVR